jgi:hypothetical protein
MRIIPIIILALCAGPALATGGHDQPSPPPQFVIDQAAQASATANSSAAATSSATANPSAAVSGVYGGGGVGGSVTDQSRSGFYVLPPPAMATPLPATVCPKGDSESISILWGLISHSKSSTRTEIECLEAFAKFLRASAPPPAQPVFFPLAPAPVAATPAAPVPPPARPAAAPKPAASAPARRAPAKKTSAAVKDCPSGQALTCQAPKK